MDLQLPPELASLLEQAGGRWPEADEDRLHELAGTWQLLATSLDAKSQANSTISRRVAGDNQGRAIDAYAGHEVQFRRHLDEAGGAASLTAAVVDGMAKATLETKKAIAGILKAAWHALSNLLSSIFKFVGSLIKKVLSWVLKAVRWLLEQIWHFVTTLVKSILEAVAKILRKVIDFFKRTLGEKEKTPPQGPVPGKWNGKHPPKEAVDKVPQEWGEGQPNKKKDGWRWTDPNNQGNGVRIDKGEPESANRSQRVDHVVVRVNGRVVGPDGKPIDAPNPSRTEEAHIPLSEWLKWESWNHP